MANNTPQEKKKKIKIRQPHLMLWFALILIILPIGYVGSNILTAIHEQSQPVEGNRFEDDLDKKIEQGDIDKIINDLKGIEHVEDVTGNLLSATLRIHVDVDDNLNFKQTKAVAEKAWSKLQETLPLDEYFKNHDDIKMYDLEVDTYNFVVDDTEEHSQDKQIYMKAVRNSGSKQGHYDYLTTPKDKELVKEIVRNEE